MGLVDALVAAAVFGYNLPLVPFYAHSPARTAAVLLVSAALCAPYPWRRRYPLPVLGLLLVAACVQLLLGVWVLPADAMLLLALYNVATRHPWRVSLPGAAATIGWLLVAVLPRLRTDFIDLGELGALVLLTLWAWTWGTLVRIRRQYIAGLRERAEQAERERESQARIAVAEERARIARETHDIVSHGLGAMVVLSDAAAATATSEPERAKEAMLTVRDTGRTALADMRRMLGVLRDDEPTAPIPQPGISQLDDLISRSRKAGVPAQLSVEGQAVPLSPGLELTIYRVVQECLTNVGRHAGPVTRVAVRIGFRPDAVEVRVTDDGRGTGDAPAGFGVIGMRERVSAHGGTFRAGPAEDGGFEVVAVLPAKGES